MNTSYLAREILKEKNSSLKLFQCYNKKIYEINITIVGHIIALINIVAKNVSCYD